jgi:hypothetical protein
MNEKTMIQGQAAKAATQDKVAQKERHRHSTDGTRCPVCGAEIDSRFEICPECGGKLVNYCTFCGADMDRSDTECPECGMPAGGVKCPKCGTLNHRSFCSACNEPLTRAAQKAIQKALADPKVQLAAEMCSRLAELEAELEAAGADISEDSSEEGNEPLSEGARRMMEIMGKVKPGMPEHAKPAQPAPADPKPVSAKRDVAKIKEEYRRTVRDVNKILDEMLPPAGSTPQEQRNFFSARKVAVETTIRQKVKVPIEWICNYCGCHHKNPSECAEPQLGGTWVYIEKVETTTVRE